MGVVHQKTGGTHDSTWNLYWARLYILKGSEWES